jgi:hypothetical protein
MNDLENNYAFIKDARERDNHIIPECYIDTVLMEVLIPPDKQYNHQKGAPAVAKKMKEGFADSFAVGIIDKDKMAISYKKEFQLVVEKNDISLYKHSSKNHYLIYHPPFEKWLISEAKKTNVSLKEYGLPNDFKELMKITKPPTPDNNLKFKKLFQALKKGNATGIFLLFKWADYLISNPYNADITKLKNIGIAP